MKEGKVKTEVKTLLMQSPMAEKQYQSGELVIRLSLSDDIPEKAANSPQADQIGEEGMKTAGYMMIEAEIKVGDLKENEIIGATPQQYMDNGIIAGILDAIRHGLADDRGINFKYAVEEAREKAESAVQCIEAEGLMDKVNKIGLAISEAGGNA